MSDISVVIVSYNTRELLRKCLCSLVGDHPGLSSDVVVVDNASRDGTVPMLKEEFPWVKLIQNSLNRGFAKAANQGIRNSESRYVLLLNPDTFVLRNAIETLVAFMEEHVEAGVAGAKLLHPDGTLQPTCRSFPRYSFLLFGRKSLLTRLFPSNRFSRKHLLQDLDHDTTQEVDFVAGAAMMVRRKVLEEVGLLDEGFFLFAEDTDLCYRIKEKGWKVYFVPHAQIVHHLGGSTRDEKGRAVLEHHKSFYRWLCKHYRPSPLMRAVLLVAVTFRIITLISLRTR